MFKSDFWRRVWLSFTSTSALYAFSKEPGRRALRYFFTFLVAFGLLYGAGMGYLARLSMVETIGTVRSGEFPDFRLEGGSLSILLEEPQVLQVAHLDTILIVDPDHSYSLNDLAGYTQGVLVNPDRIILSQAGNPPVPLEFSTFPDLVLDRAALAGILEAVLPYVFPAFLLVYLLVFLFSGFLKAFLVSIFGLLLKNLMVLEMPFSRIFRTTLYAASVPYLASELMNLVPFLYWPLLRQAIAFGFPLLLLYRFLGEVRRLEAPPQE
ncbi:DUF1189 family protein [Anaerotalea alkaliphila]|uniref:DUF1189 domain-containing protein n=1 Tax=Anaerotalea alkaliphila TaxID=2662126 RepID=A0A7X5KNX5_9FIRM|nr:DUF1189 family protein [Anaerotalea alkaliphila]NDL67217.1 DUF1189 domain-containing protein [Anaerotalea alkaliphila]